jgi:hypothetical protein
MRLTPLLLTLLFGLTQNAHSVGLSGKCVKRQIRIAVIDTGFGYSGIKKDTKLCGIGHTDFSKDHNFIYMRPLSNLIPKDTVGHGTNIVGIIENYAKKSNVDYCIVILKFYSKDQTDKQNLKASIAAIQFATELKADFINYSGGGPSENAEEGRAVRKFLDQGGKFIAAAGNDGEEIGTGDTDFYPAMYDKRIVVVGNLDKYGVRSKTSNYGRFVNRWEMGEDVTGYGIKLSGTSQATAVATGKILAASENKCTLKKK